MSETILGQDILLENGTDLKFSSNQDFAYVSGRNNFKQAIITRLSTVKGEFFVPAYGSELSSTIGKPRDAILKNRITGYVVEAMKQEPRTKEIKEISISFPSDDKKSVELSLSVLPIESQVPLNLVFPLFV